MTSATRNSGRLSHWFDLAMLFIAVAASHQCFAARAIAPALWLEGHRDSITALAFLPDGRRAVSASADHTIRVWDLESGQLVRSINAHGKAVNTVAASPDGKQIASGGEDNLVRVWDPETGRQLSQLEGHTLAVMKVQFLKGGRLVSVGRDGVRLWDVAGEKELWHFHPHFRVDAADIALDGARAAFTTDDGVTEVWDIEARNQLKQYGPTSLVPNHVLFTPDGQQLIYMTGSQLRYELRDLAQDKVLELPIELNQAPSIAFSPDSHRLLVAEPGRANVYEYPSFNQQTRINVNIPEPIRAMAISPDGKTVLLGSGGKQGATTVDWLPGRLNKIAVVRFSDTSTANTPAASGQVSWQIVHAMVHPRDGELRPFSAMDWYGDVMHQGGWPFRRVSNDTDIVVSPATIFMHHEGGTLEEAFTDRQAGFTDVVPDGNRLWALSTAKGIFLLDRNCKALGHCGLAEGFPLGDRPPQMCLMGSGKLLVIGTHVEHDPKPKLQGWVVAVEYDAVAGKLGAKLLGSSTALPAGWPGTESAFFLPTSLVPPIAQAAHAQQEALIFFPESGSGKEPKLRVNGQTMTATVDVTPTTHRIVESRYPTGDVQELADGRFLAWNGAVAWQFVMNNKGWDSRAQSRRFSQGSGPPLLLDGAIYMPGPSWYRLDPSTLEPTPLGEGITPVLRRGRGQISYTVSASLGLAGFSPDEAVFYQFSVDPKKPLPLHGDPQPPGQNR